MQSPSDWIVSARIGAPWGLAGFCHVFSFLETPADIMRFSAWHLGDETQDNPPKKEVTIEHIKAHGDHFVAKIQGCFDRNQAAQYTNLSVYLPKADFPSLSESEFYLQDLIGLLVKNEQGIVLGKVLKCMLTGANEVLVIASPRQKKPILIPFVLKEYVLDVNKEDGEILVHWDLDWA